MDIRRWSIIATFLILLGAVMFTGAMAGYGWDFTELSTADYEDNIYEITDDFDDIIVDSDVSDIVFKHSSDGRCIVECHENRDSIHSVTVRDNTLVIDDAGPLPWYIWISISFDSPKVTVYLPDTDYGNLDIELDTGDVTVPDGFLFDNVDVSTDTGDVDFSASVTDNIHMDSDTGDIELSNVECGKDIRIDVDTSDVDIIDVRCRNLVIEGDTGEKSLIRTLVTESIRIQSSTGDVEFHDSDASQIRVDTDTGDVTGNILTTKVFDARSDTGDVDVPNGTSGGICTIRTSTGDIDITVG